MHALLLDVVVTGADDTLSDLLDGLDVKAKHTGVAGGGGNPEVRFTGSWENLVVVAARYADDKYSDLPYLVRSITQVS